MLVKRLDDDKKIHQVIDKIAIWIIQDAEFILHKKLKQSHLELPEGRYNKERFTDKESMISGR